MTAVIPTSYPHLPPSPPQTPTNPSPPLLPASLPYDYDQEINQSLYQPQMKSKKALDDLNDDLSSKLVKRDVNARPSHNSQLQDVLGLVNGERDLKPGERQSESLCERQCTDSIVTSTTAVDNIYRKVPPRLPSKDVLITAKLSQASLRNASLPPLPPPSPLPKDSSIANPLSALDSSISAALSNERLQADGLTDSPLESFSSLSHSHSHSPQASSSNSQSLNLAPDLLSLRTRRVVEETANELILTTPTYAPGLSDFASLPGQQQISPPPSEKKLGKQKATSHGGDGSLSLGLGKGLNGSMSSLDAAAEFVVQPQGQQIGSVLGIKRAASVTTTTSSMATNSTVITVNSTGTAQLLALPQQTPSKRHSVAVPSGTSAVGSAWASSSDRRSSTLSARRGSASGVPRLPLPYISSANANGVDVGTSSAHAYNRRLQSISTPGGTTTGFSGEGNDDFEASIRLRSEAIKRGREAARREEVEEEESEREEEREKRRRRSGSAGREKRKEREKEKEVEKERDAGGGVLVGNLVGEGHANYVLMYNMLTGIRIAVSRWQAKVKKEVLTDEDYTSAYKYSFDFIGNELTPSAKYDFKFKDYSPWVFRSLRDYFRIDPADYLLSLTANYILSELGSPGKSGSFFYFSKDYRFIIKTIHKTEHRFLRKFLKDYHDHVLKNPHTLLSRFYGLHRVKLPRGRKIHFIVMNNLFPPHRDIHETYDLKGSAIGREFPEDLAEKKSGAVLKDLNWLHRNRHFELGPEKRMFFEEQLKRDTEFLKRQGIMDYSLLIGLHDLGRGNKENLRGGMLTVFQPDTVKVRRKPTLIQQASALRKAVRKADPKALSAAKESLPEQEGADRKHFIFYQDEGGFRATDDQNKPMDMIYYLGIIDILTPYNTVKRIEHFFKGLKFDKHMISAVPPIEYGDRFLTFLTSFVRGADTSHRPKME